MSSHDQAAETLRDFVSTQVRKMFKNTRDEARRDQHTQAVPDSPPVVPPEQRIEVP